MREEGLTDAYARLKQLSISLELDFTVEEKYVREFHSILDSLMQSSGFDLSAFRVPDEDIRPKGIKAIMEEGQLCSDHRYCRRTVLMKRIYGLLSLESCVSSIQ